MGKPKGFVLFKPKGKSVLYLWIKQCSFFSKVEGLQFSSICTLYRRLKSAWSTQPWSLVMCNPNEKSSEFIKNLRRQSRYDMLQDNDRKYENFCDKSVFEIRIT